MGGISIVAAISETAVPIVAEPSSQAFIGDSVALELHHVAVSVPPAVLTANYDHLPRPRPTCSDHHRYSTDMPSASSMQQSSDLIADRPDYPISSDIETEMCHADSDTNAAGLIDNVHGRTDARTRDQLEAGAAQHNKSLGVHTPHCEYTHVCTLERSHARTHALTHELIAHSLAHSLIRSLARSLTHSLTHSLYSRMYGAAR